jgi:hypothetical protein
MEPFTQIPDPLNSVAVSTLLALIPVAVLLLSLVSAASSHGWRPERVRLPVLDMPGGQLGRVIGPGGQKGTV